MLRQGLNYRVVSILVLVVVASFVFAPVALAIDTIVKNGVVYIDQNDDGTYVRKGDGAEFELNSKGELIPILSTGGTTPGSGGLKQFINFTNPLTSKSLTGLLGKVLDWLKKIGVILAVGFLSWGGLKLVTSKGEPGETSKAKGVITYAALGLLVLFSASFLANVIIDAIGGSTAESAGKADELYDRMAAIGRYFYGIILGLSVFFLVWGGFKFFLAKGEPQALSTARKNILYGIIGLAVIMGVWIIITLIGSIAGIDPVDTAKIKPF